MKYTTIPGVSKRASKIAQGTIMLRTDRLDEGFELFDAVFRAGINVFDSAHVYGGGESDKVFAAWVNDRVIRDEIILLDKGAHHDGDRQRVTPEDITSDLHDCLERLGFDTIDIFGLHRDDPSKPVGPIIDVLNKHLEEGTIDAFAASNWRHERIREANEYAARNGLRGFSISSPHYSLGEQYDDPWGNSVTITGDKNTEARR